LSRKSSSIEISTVASPSPLLLTSFISAYGRTSSSGKRTRHCSSSDGITTISATSYLAIARARASSPTKTQRKMSSISSSSTSTSYNNNNILQPQVQNRVALLQLPVTHNKDINLQTAITYIRQAHTAGAQLCVLPEIWNSPYATSAFPEYAELLPQVGDCLLPSKSAYGTTVEERNNEAEKDDDNGITWGKSSRMLMEMAKLTNMYIVGGSIPEVVVVDVHETSLSKNSDNHEQTTSTMNRYKYYNTCLVINPHGKVVAKHRKVHLFDVNVPGGIQFRESETLTPGDLGATYFDVAEKDEEEDENEETNKDDARSRASNCELGRIGIGIWYVIVVVSISAVFSFITFSY
jgi:predicted amidohydrolase